MINFEYIGFYVFVYSLCFEDVFGVFLNICRGMLRVCFVYVFLTCTVCV